MDPSREQRFTFLGLTHDVRGSVLCTTLASVAVSRPQRKLLLFTVQGTVHRRSTAATAKSIAMSTRCVIMHLVYGNGSSNSKREIRRAKSTSNGNGNCKIQTVVVRTTAISRIIAV